MTVIWALSDGRAGMRNQALGLAEAVAQRTDGTVIEKTVRIAGVWDRLPAALWGDPFSRLAEDADEIAPPWPDVSIGCGRRTVPFQLRMPQSVLTVQTQDPRTDPRRFGLVVPPAHDELDGANVFPILGSPNRLSEARLVEGAEALERHLPPLPRPFAAFLIGGDSKDYRFTPHAAQGIADVAEEAVRLGHGLLVTFSRRTPEAAMAYFLEAFEEMPVWVWDGRDLPGLGNPYLGIMGLAERFFVTNESANMLAEVGFTGRPVHALPLQGGAPKWRRFHEQLERHGVLRPDAGMDERWTYEPLRETDRAAEAVLAALRERRGG